jgi:hypothetical protein
MLDVYLIFRASLLCTFSWVLWKVVTQFVVKHPLDEIPGPPPQSYLWGPFDSDFASIDLLTNCITGNFKQVFNTQSWAFHQNLVDQYGGVAKIRGAFGVS